MCDAEVPEMHPCVGYELIKTVKRKCCCRRLVMIPILTHMEDPGVSALIPHRHRKTCHIRRIYIHLHMITNATFEVQNLA